jgi:CRISPR type III-A-associated protein Csm2
MPKEFHNDHKKRYDNPGNQHDDVVVVKEVVFSSDLVLHTNEKNYHTLIDKVKAYTRVLVDNKITTHQLRNIYHQAKHANSASELWKLEVTLAYLAGRNESNRKFKDFAEMLSRLIRETKEDTLDNFKEFLTTVVAYHKFNEKFFGKGPKQ